MSAFLFYSLKKRHQIKKENPDMKNTDVSRVLGEMWRSLNDEERQPFVDKEKEERDKYKVAIAEWRKKIAAKQTDHFNSQIDYSPQHHFPPAVGVHMDHYAPAALGASSHIYQPVPHPTGKYIPCSLRNGYQEPGCSLKVISLVKRSLLALFNYQQMESNMLFLVQTVCRSTKLEQERTLTQRFVKRMDFRRNIHHRHIFQLH